MKGLAAGVLGRARTSSGEEILLHHRDGVFQIRVDGLELMASRAHGSEDALASLALAGIRNEAPRVLIGGLGLGYTLRAALDRLPPSALVTVAEIFPAVVAWNRAPLAHLAGRPLDDERVRPVVADVATLLRRPAVFDAVLLDVDNGPGALSVASNAGLYGAQSLASIRRCLRPGGVLAVWSADADDGFEARLVEAGFVVRREDVGVRGTGGRGVGGRSVVHTVYLGQV